MYLRPAVDVAPAEFPDACIRLAEFRVVVDEILEMG